MGKRLTRAMKRPVNISVEALRREQLSKYISNKVFAEIVIGLDGDTSNQELIDDLYKQELCKLPTKNLELMLETHEENLFIRQEDTIESIVSELARRVLMEKK